MLGCGFAGITFLLLGFANELGVAAALGALIFGRFAFEFAIVSSLITVSEQSPSQRSRVMSIMGFFTTISLALAGLTGPVAVGLWGVYGLGIPTGIGFLMAVGLTYRYIDVGSNS